MSQVIQYGVLEELLAEPLGHGDIVRVVVLGITESVSNQIPGLRRVGIGVHVRTINRDGHILACYLPVARVELYNGRREGDPTWQAYDDAFSQAKALQQRVLSYLRTAAAEKGFTVRPAGVINIGQTTLLSATWATDPAGSQRGSIHELEP